MSGVWKPVLVVLFVTIGSHLAVIHILPGFIMAIAMDRISAAAVETAEQALEGGSAGRPELYQTVIDRAGWNAPLASPRADHNQRYVVRSSSDILYSACVFDLAEGPLRVTAPKTGGYASISAFAANTDNFVVLDDRQSQGPALSIVIHRPEQAVPSSVGGARAASPTERGIVLVRYLIENEDLFERYVERQYEINCDPL